jgi:type IV pilus assembly protein PilW
MSHMSERRSSALHRVTGFSLVELLVAMAIGLIGTVVIFQVFAVFEGQKRTATSAGDAQQNGLLAMANIERDARMAGYGLSFAPLLGCNVSAYDNTRGTPAFNFWLVAAQIDLGAGGAPDTLTFEYSNSGQLVAPAKVVTTANLGTALTVVDSYFGFKVGDLVIAGNAGPSPLPACTMRALTATPTSAPPSGNPGELDHAGGRFNAPGGLAATYPAWDLTTQTGGRVYGLGAAPPSAAAPAVAVYTAANGQLLYQNLIQDAAATPVVDGIVQLKAQYGLDDNGDGILQTTEWRNPCTAPVAPNPPQLPKGAAPGVCANPTNTDWSHVIAVRFAVLARSAQPEKPDPATLICNTTTAAPTWAGGTIDPSVPDPTTWKCYRYRVFETVVPIRNFIWAPL